MLEEKNFNINAETEDAKESHHRHHHSAKSNSNKKGHHHSKVVPIDTLNTAQIPVQGSGIKCDYCGKQHCDQPNHPACLQQQKLCEEQRLNQIKQQQLYQQQLTQQLLQDSRPNSKSETPDFSLKNDPFNSLSRSQQYTIQTGSALFECTGAIRKAGFLSVKKWILRKRQHVELAKYAYNDINN